MAQVSSELIDELANASLTDDKLFSHPLVKELMSQLSIPRTRDTFTWNAPLELKDEGERIIAGYASVELVDKQGDLIPLEVLKKAWDKFSSNPDFMNSQLLHSNVPIAKFILSHPKCDKKAGVDDKGLFVIAKVRDDIKKADEAWQMIKDNELRAFSIGGEALKRSMVCDGRCYKRIDELELHEISIVGAPANQGSYFTIIKSERLLKLDDVLKQFPEGMILIKDFVNLVGSVVEKGVSTHDFDVLIRHELDENSFLRRAVLTRLQKQFPESIVGRGGDVDVFFGDTAGPHDSYVPIYDLVLLRRSPTETVPMKLEKGPSTLLKSDNISILKGILKDLSSASSALEKTQICSGVLETLKQCSEDVSKVWSDEAREAALAARQGKPGLESHALASSLRDKIRGVALPAGSERARVYSGDVRGGLHEDGGHYYDPEGGKHAIGHEFARDENANQYDNHLAVSHNSERLSGTFMYPPKNVSEAMRDYTAGVHGEHAILQDDWMKMKPSEKEQWLSK